ncbi:MAG: 50S ribosomal protein L11 methyltransferase [Saprospiraceae bacterium]|nr:50S ribosomal protein L11 methyltransferase [Saprospiraceae bacterium]
MILKFHFRTAPESVDFLIAMMIDLPFTAFEEVEEGFVTAVQEADWKVKDQEFIDQLQRNVHFNYSVVKEEPQNWNAIWESGFKEIIIDSFCTIRAPFHKTSAESTYEIVIEPRMAFGTGHHETTRLMVRSMQKISLIGKQALDFGSGSGILAILAVKMGANPVFAVESDEQAVVNLLENIRYNNTDEITARCNDQLVDFPTTIFDVVLANITRNVLMDHANELRRITKKNGTLTLSGFLSKDHDVILQTFKQADFEPIFFLEENDWIAQTFKKL